jgi:MarR family transcriptional regulator, lower aerobic nicotinate degradation pathway regulator
MARSHTLAPVAELPIVEQPTHRCSALLDFLARRMRTAGLQTLEPLGLRPRHLLALTVLRDHGASGQQQLAEVLDIDPTNLVLLLNELERERLVERRRSEEDRRRHVVELTSTGRELLARAEMALGATEEIVLGALDRDEREALYMLLARAVDGLAAGDDPLVASCSVD